MIDLKEVFTSRTVSLEQYVRLTKPEVRSEELIKPRVGGYTELSSLELYFMGLDKVGLVNGKTTLLINPHVKQLNKADLEKTAKYRMERNGEIPLGLPEQTKLWDGVYEIKDDQQIISTDHLWSVRKNNLSRRTALEYATKLGLTAAASLALIAVLDACAPNSTTGDEKATVVKEVACEAEIDLKILPPLPNNLTLTGKGPGSFFYETERRTEIGHVVRETISYMMAAKIWAQMGSPKFYNTDELNIPNNPGDLLNKIADIVKCGYETSSILKVPDQTLFDVSDPKTFKIAQRVAALLDRRLKNTASLPPLPNYYPSGLTDQTYEDIDRGLKVLVLAQFEAALKDMHNSNPTLQKYAEVLRLLRQGKNPNSLLITFGFNNQLYVPKPLQVDMPAYNENGFGQGYIANTSFNMSLIGDRSDGELQIAFTGLKIGTGFPSLTREAQMLVLAKEAAMTESELGLFRATIKR